MATPEEIAELQAVSPGAKEITEGGQVYIHLPTLSLPPGCGPSPVEALLCLSQHTGYPTRLFLSQAPGRGSNPSSHCIMGRTWHTWSWNYIPASLRPIEVLAEHLRGLQ